MELVVGTLTHRTLPSLEICDVQLQDHALFGERYQGVGDCFVARDQTVELLLARAVGGQVVAARLRSQSVGARIEIAQARDQRRARGVGKRRQVTGVINPSVERALLPSEPEQRLNSAEQPAIRGRRGLGHTAHRSRYRRSTLRSSGRRRRPFADAFN